MNPPSDQLRIIIDTCGMTRYQLARVTGVSEAALSRLMNGKHMTTDTLDRLAPVLGLRIVTTKQKKKRRQMKGR